MANGEVQNAPAIEEATDQLGGSQDEQQDDWSPNDLNEQQRAQYERGVAAVDEFLKDERTKHYEPTDPNREKLLAYLEEHDLPLSFGGLYVAFEQLSEAGDLELAEGDAGDKDRATQVTNDESIADRIRQASTAQLRGTKSQEEPPESDESEPEVPQEEIGKRGKPVAWRNGRAVIGVGS